MQSLYEYIVYYADRTPDHPCIVEVETGQTLTYAECLQALLSMRRQFGSEPKNIFLSIPGGIISAVVWLAALTGGHTLVPLSPDAVADEVQRAQRMFAPDIALFQQHGMEESVFPSTTRMVTAQECASWLDGQPAQHPWWPMTSTRIGSVCVMTSGSTGEPKGVVLTASQVLWTAEQISRVHQLTPQDRGLTTLPFFHINAPVVSLCASIVSGSTVMIASRFSRHRF